MYWTADPFMSPVRVRSQFGKHPPFHNSNTIHGMLLKFFPRTSSQPIVPFSLVCVQWILIHFIYNIAYISTGTFPVCSFESDKELFAHKTSPNNMPRLFVCTPLHGCRWSWKRINSPIIGHELTTYNNSFLRLLRIIMHINHHWRGAR